MVRLFKKTVLNLIATGMVLGSGSMNAFAQQASAPSVSSPYQHKFGHMRGVLMGMCVSQTLAANNTPVVVVPGQKLGAANWQLIKAAKASCRAAFKAARAASSSTPAS